MYFCNHKLVHGTEKKKLTGLYIYSDGLSIGKSALLNCITEITHTYKHCLTDNGLQKQYDVNTSDDERYKAYLLDGFNDPANYDFSIFENICEQNVDLKSRATLPGTLKKRTPFIKTSNLSPNLIGELQGKTLT